MENLFPRRSKVQAVEHHAALPYNEIGAFVATLRTQEGAGALALQFTILTAARTGEVIGAKWSEIDLGADLKSNNSLLMTGASPLTSLSFRS